MPATHRQRRRAQLSCDRCRRLKRKCDRQSPCSLCVDSQSSCTWDGRAREQAKKPPSLEVAAEKGVRDYTEGGHAPSVGKESHAAAAWSARTPACVTQSGEDELEAVLNLSGFIDVVLTIWFRDLDYMYDILGDSDFEAEWRKGILTISGDNSSSRYAPVFLAVCAIVGQLHSTDLESAFLAQRGDFVDPSWLANRCFEEASRRIEQEHCVEEDALPPLEHLQASLLLCAYCKNAGYQGQYRDMIYRDISRLQRRGLHQQGSHPSIAEEAMSNRIFWAYFTYDRLYFMMEDLPYCLASQHANVWLQDDQGVRIHVQDLCSGASNQPPKSTPSATAAHMSLSVFVTSMAKLAALLGRYADRLSGVQQTLEMNPTLLPEEIASQAGQELSNLEQEISLKINGTELLPLLPQVSARVRTLHPSQRHVIAMTIAKLKSDFASRLIRHLERFPLSSISLHYQRVHSASKILQLALSVAAKLPVRHMAWGFFLFYTYEPIIELLDSLCQGDIILTTAVEHLSLALSGRNLLVMIARETKTDAAERIAKKVCVCSADTLHQIGGIQQELVEEARCPRSIVKVQRTVDNYRNCSSTQALDIAFDSNSFLTNSQTEPSSLPSLQALEELLRIMANPALA